MSVNLNTPSTAPFSTPVQAPGQQNLISSVAHRSGRPARVGSGISIGDPQSAGSRVYRAQLYWLEFRKDGKPYTLPGKITRGPGGAKGYDEWRIALPYVQSLNVTETTPSIVSYTIGTNAHIDRTHVRDRIVTLSGRTGVDMIYDGTVNRSLDPVVHFDNMRSVLELFSHEGVTTDTEGQLRGQGGQNPLGVRMVLRSSFEQFNHLAEPVSFTYKRSTTTKFSVEWTLTLKIYSPFRHTDGMQLYSALSGHPVSFMETLRRGRNLLNSARASYRRNVTGRLQRAAHQFTHNTVGLLNVLRQSTVELAAETVAYATGAARRWYVGASLAISRWEGYFESLTWVEQQSYRERSEFAEHGSDGNVELSMILIGACGYIIMSAEPHALKTNPTTLPDNNLFVPSADPLFGVPQSSPETTIWSGPAYPVVVLEGDTLVSIAVRELGVSEWLTLAQLNHMKSPSTYLDGSPLAAGDVILCPDYLNKTQIKTFDPYHAYGVDLLLGADGDLVLRGATTDDVELAAGAYALRQGLTHRMLVRKGDSLVFPNFGLSEGPGDAATFIRMSGAVQDVVHQMEADPRVRTCIINSALDAGDGFIVNSTVVAKDGIEATINVPVGY
jgi:hypothetical protein